jgi:hypothetical protein
VTPNLAGNGDLETGTLTGWSSFATPSPLVLSSPAALGYAHAGQFSAELSARTQFYQGPAYALPTGLGKYSITAWAMETQDTTVPPTLGVQIRLLCLTSSSFINVYMGTVGMSAPAGTWIRLGGDVDTRTSPTVAADCLPEGPNGVVRSATVYIDQVTPEPASPNATPDLYVDDLVVQSTDGHNLIGNPTFEAGTVDGWSVAGGTAMLKVSSTVAHGGQRSLWQASRTLPTAAVAYALPIGAARYAVSLWGMQGGTTVHQLALLPLYSCIGSSVVHSGAPSAAVTAPPGVWTQVTGTFVLPPADAPAGCVLSQASVTLGQAETGTCGSTVECPDLFVDDASITLK